MGINIISDISDKIHKTILPFGEMEDFSFRKSSSYNKIYICPNSLMRASDINGDVSIKKTITNGNDFYTEILDKVPAVQIREYVCSSRLKQLMNLFGAFTDGIADSQNFSVNFSKLSEFLNPKDDNSGINKLYKKLVEKIGKTEFGNDLKNNWQSTIEGKFGEFGELSDKVFKIPFYLYYGIVTGKNTGHYIIPYNGNIVDESSGSDGWPTAGSLGPNIQGGAQSTIFKTILGYLGKNLRFTMQPQWSGGSEKPFPQITVQFNLFNDSKEAAINNYIFINNIVAKNKYLQYHFLQHNPAVYDIKIEGFNRFFMCSSNIKVESKGVQRIPHQDVLTAIQGKQTSTFQGIAKTDKGEFYSTTGNSVRIPDVYSVTLTFNSLLPNSLNNYLFSRISNQDIDKAGGGNGLDFGNKFSQVVGDEIAKTFKEEDIIVTK